MPVNSWNTSPSNTSSLPTEERAREARSGLAIVLAAGEGTRMRSNLPKVLHRVANRAIVSHVLGAIAASGVESLAVVIGPDRDDVANEVRRTAPQASIHVQCERLGTAHAALAARDAIAAGADDVIVAFGDTPLVRPETFALLRRVLANGAAVVVLGFEAANPHGYGRLLMEDGQLVAIREEKDASEAERAVTLCNGGIMAIAGTHALSLLDSVRNDNAKGEYYLTDIVQLARERGLSVAVQVAEEAELLGINDRVQLAAAESVLQHRLREATMRNGVTMTAPETVFLSWDTVLGQDVVVEPHVVFGPGVRVDEGVVIRAFSHIEGAHIRARADAGPFARLRPGADIGEGAHIGNFVEVKNSVLARGVKVGHLTYLGDSDVGADTNIGAGTITCNYDGWKKHRTVIGAGTFIGSNSSLVAPVTIGAGAYVASGSVVTEAVPADALAIGRGRQVNKEDRARLFREAAGKAGNLK